LKSLKKETKVKKVRQFKLTKTDGEDASWRRGLQEKRNRIKRLKEAIENINTNLERETREERRSIVLGIRSVS
jgi:hypothetical protein